MSDNLKEAFEKTKIAGSIAAGALDEVSKIINPGISTNQIDQVDRYTNNMIIQYGL